MNAQGISLAVIKPISDDIAMPDGSTELTTTEQAGDNIGNYIQNTLYSQYRDARRNEQEDICLQCERAYNNKYSLPDHAELSKRKAESGDSTVFVPITRSKINIAVAKTYEKMLNTSDNPWSIVPTELNESDKKQNEFTVLQAAKAGVLQEEPERVLEKLNEYSETQQRNSADEMEKEIAEQMNKGSTATAIARVIQQQHYLGTGIAKFEISVRNEETWTDEQGVWGIQEEQIPFPDVKFKSWFDIFTDPYAKSMDDASGLIERHVMKRSDLLDLKESQGFDEGKIQEIILNAPAGNHIDEDYETTIRGINNQDQNLTHSDNRYDVFEAWVEISGDKLIEYGMEGVIPTGSYKVNCWSCGNVTIKLIMNPHSPQKIPYFIVPYEENTNSINGTGIAENLFGPQEVINSVTRATIDNAAFSHAPMIEQNVSMLKSGETPVQSLRPRHVFLREGGDPKEPMIRFYQPTENSGVLYNINEMFSKIAEDVTGISSSTEESMPSANTANMGISMALSQKNILQRSVVHNIDQYLIKPMIEMYYNFNMKWSDKNDIKCSAKVTANGVTSIIAKEMRSQQLMAFAQLTNNDIDNDIVNRKEILEELATSLDQDSEKLIYSDRQSEDNKQQKSESQMKAAQAEQQGIIAQIDAENRGESEQERLKGDINYKKQQLIERSKITQLAAKQEIEVTPEEMHLLQQLRGQYNANR